MSISSLSSPPFRLKRRLFHTLIILALACFFNSCGVVSKARYGNGYKLNLGEWFSKDEQREPKKTQKKSFKIVPVQEHEVVKTIPQSLEISTSDSNLIANLFEPSEVEDNKHISKLHTSTSQTQNSNETSEKSQDEDVRELEPLTQTGTIIFLSAYFILLGELLFYWALPEFLIVGLGIVLFLSLILCIIGYRRAMRNPDRFKGKKLAFGMIIFALASWLALLIYGVITIINYIL